MGVVPDCWSKILLGVLGVLAIRLRRTDSNQPLAADVVPLPLKGTLGDVMNKSDHAKSCQEALGKPYAEVHDFLDQYSDRFPREQRKVYHHRQGLARIAERFGPEAVKAAQIHIVEDVGFVPEDHTYFHTDNRELIRIVELMYGPPERCA